MSAQGPATTAADSGASALHDWEAVRAQADIQFAKVALPKLPPQQPSWFDRFLEWLGQLLKPAAEALGVSWPVVQWILLGITVMVALYVLYRLLDPQFRRRPAREQEAVDWQPERAAAMALLEDADRLAAEGRFGEATHLLLRRSVNQIAAIRPEWLGPSTTAREIAALPGLPERARAAFAAIATRVEHSLFALRQLDAEDWRQARGAYADFALADLRQGAGA